MKRIVKTTDNQHIGLLIEMPEVGQFLRLHDSEFIVIKIEGGRIVCFNYIVEVE